MTFSGRRIRLGSVLQIALLLSSPAEAFAGKLNRVRDQARTSSSDSGSSDDSNGSSNREERHRHHDDHYHGHDPWHDHHDHGNSLADDLCGIGFLEALVGVSSPFWAPPQLLSDDGGNGFYPDHPYDDAVGGLLHDKSTSGAHDTLVVLQGQYGDDFGGISHANGRLIVETAWRLGIDTEFNYRHEGRLSV